MTDWLSLAEAAKLIADAGADPKTVIASIVREAGEAGHNVSWRVPNLPARVRSRAWIECPRIDITAGVIEIEHQTLRRGPSGRQVGNFTLLVSRQALPPRLSKKGAGPKPKADWEAIAAAYWVRVGEIGRPNVDHDDQSWRTKADVKRWMHGILQDRCEHVCETQVALNARQLYNKMSPSA